MAENAARSVAGGKKKKQKQKKKQTEEKKGTKKGARENAQEGFFCFSYRRTKANFEVAENAIAVAEKAIFETGGRNRIFGQAVADSPLRSRNKKKLWHRVHLCFSVVTTDRTYDFSAEDPGHNFSYNSVMAR